ncbi:alpha/beta hydrolase fold-domain-containing protein [Crucibulum laeve]|uniref:Alpha/beta hydrolase fold-domain-containing protein n=1 Tax=Crucibulum laeve TaxID=68775 RepID=A0A5C3LF17_9AGAR|nr:alpha/beta hydrolase fold-domain-containing protein [Crucibulum laeve]
MNTSHVPQQPIHPSVLPKLDPEYVEFHNANFLHLVPPHTLPWDPAIRNAPTVPGGSEPLNVGNIQDYDLTYAKFRAFTPEGDPPANGWPVLIYFHGGGWTLGNISSETTVCTNMCVRANCVVVSVDYRLAPEHPYPAAVEDAVEALQWVFNKGGKELRVDVKKIAVGGASSGGNLATILALKAAESISAIPLILQLLIVPVTDNTASTKTSWASNQHSPWLSPGRMLWFKANYLPNKEDWTKWDASPIFAPDELLKKTPKAWIGVAELDILKEEGVAYGEKLKKAGVDVQVEIYKGAPHPTLAMDGVMKLGKKMISDAVTTLRTSFECAA